MSDDGPPIEDLRWALAWEVALQTPGGEAIKVVPGVVGQVPDGNCKS